MNVSISTVFCLFHLIESDSVQTYRLTHGIGPALIGGIEYYMKNQGSNRRILYCQRIARVFHVLKESIDRLKSWYESNTELPYAHSPPSVLPPLSDT